MRFRITCTTTNVYECIVDAPNEEAAEQWYNGDNQGEVESKFRKEADEDNWEMVRQRRLDDIGGWDVRVNEQGEDQEL